MFLFFLHGIAPDLTNDTNCASVILVLDNKSSKPLKAPFNSLSSITAFSELSPSPVIEAKPNNILLS